MKRARANKRNKYEGINREAYFTPTVAVTALLEIEGDRIPEDIYEPAVGSGNIAKELERRGHNLYCADVHDYGYPGTVIEDYLTALPPPWVEGIITNPPFRYAHKFVAKAISEVPYVAMLGRIGYLESMTRKAWLEEHPPTSVIIPSRRLPMMHRLDWEGPLNSSNICHPWFVWDEENKHGGGLTNLIYYDWENYQGDGYGDGDKAGDCGMAEDEGG